MKIDDTFILYGAPKKVRCHSYYLVQKEGGRGVHYPHKKTGMYISQERPVFISYTSRKEYSKSHGPFLSRPGP